MSIGVIKKEGRKKYNYQGTDECLSSCRGIEIIACLNIELSFKLVEVKESISYQLINSCTCYSKSNRLLPFSLGSSRC
jgi:hypothetical protein